MKEEDAPTGRKSQLFNDNEKLLMGVGAAALVILVAILIFVCRVNISYIIKASFLLEVSKGYVNVYVKKNYRSIVCKFSKNGCQSVAQRLRRSVSSLNDNNSFHYLIFFQFWYYQTLKGPTV